MPALLTVDVFTVEHHVDFLHVYLADAILRGRNDNGENRKTKFKEGASTASDYGTVSNDCKVILGDEATLLSKIPEEGKRAFKILQELSLFGIYCRYHHGRASIML